MTRNTDLKVPLDFFRGFEAAARHSSFTRAAEELFVTQSAISRQIQSLEERLGVPLFVRHGRGLVLTEAGQEMHRAATAALRLLREAAERIAPGARHRLVTVTSSLAFCSLWLIPRLAGFRRAKPEVDVRIAADNQVLDQRTAGQRSCSGPPIAWPAPIMSDCENSKNIIILCVKQGEGKSPCSENFRRPPPTSLPMPGYFNNRAVTRSTSAPNCSPRPETATS